MKVELDLEWVNDSGFGPRAELSIVMGDRRRVIFSEYPNPGYRGGIEAAAFSLIAARFENAMKELSLERS